ncbi:hypothetical protein SAMN04488121_107255 [Chitinophaga filiformis]|uniref:Uncharacterized protein n=1 Tax=Chitinophaga filiformis TaxID=104663 RepID=A0A1G7YAH3_CHIFI|nr:hypothetical protein SAMN04488121_107255 [Chitinophaga filiformis]
MVSRKNNNRDHNKPGNKMPMDSVGVLLFVARGDNPGGRLLQGATLGK